MILGTNIVIGGYVGIAQVKIEIHPSVTEEQQRDPRFQKLLRDAEIFFNSSENDRYKLLLGLHESGHICFARRAGGTNIRRYGPRMMWDSRPQYNCPAISKSAVSWTPNGGSTVANLKAHIAGFIVRRELSDFPNDHIAIETDLDKARDWFDKNVGTGDEAFQKVLRDAEGEILIDLRSPKTRHEIWTEARRFVNEVFPAVPNYQGEDSRSGPERPFSLHGG